MPISTGSKITWEWILTGVALTFLAVYLLNNIKPGFVVPYTVEGFASSPALPSDDQLVPLGEEWQEY